MPFFRRKSEKSKAEVPQPLKVTDGGAALKRTPSNRSDRSLGQSSYNGDIGMPESLAGRATGGGKRPATLLLQTLQDSQHAQASDPGPSSPRKTSSRLSKTLSEILHDQNGVACFLNFMKTQRAVDLIQFWLDSESFRVSTLMRVRTQSFNSSGNQGNSSTSPKNETNRDFENQISTKDIQGSVQQTTANISSNDSSCPETSIRENRNTSEEKGESESDKSARTDTTNCEQSNTNSAPTGVLPDPQVDPGGSGKIETEGDTKEGNDTMRLTKSLSKEEIKEKLKKSIQHDAVTIFTKYISQDAPNPIGVTEELRAQAIRRICQESGMVDPQCFTECQQFVFQRMDKEHFANFLTSEFHCKHQVDVLTSGKVFLADILYNELALSYFMEFLDAEGACHLLQFWLVADNFQQHLTSTGGSYDGVEAQNDAMVLYDKYFSLQATQPLGFDDETRFAVEGNICREGGPLPDCFSMPRDLVLKTLEQYYFPAYVRSEMYYKYLSDLVSTVQSSQVPHRPKHRRTESDASSEHSAGSQSMSGADSIKNTLLAMDTSHMKRAFTRIEDDMRIDSMLLNPDELWKRPEQGLMPLGKVNDLGQFESLFDPEPDRDKKKGTRFFKKKKEKEKEQEDMALRVAQMIISDVTTMTQTGDIYAGVASSSPKLNRSHQHSAITDKDNIS